MRTSGTTLEPFFWIGLAVAAYIFSAPFDRDDEIYRFGAAGWPRVIIAAILVAAVLQAVQRWRVRRATGPSGEIFGRAPAADPSTGWDLTRSMRTAAILGLPLAYAAMLDAAGFYLTTPLFILLVLVLGGERRPAILAAVTAAAYALVVLIFTKVFYVGLPVGYQEPFYSITTRLLSLLQ